MVYRANTGPCQLGSDISFIAEMPLDYFAAHTIKLSHFLEMRRMISLKMALHYNAFELPKMAPGSCRRREADVVMPLVTASRWAEYVHERRLYFV